VGHEAGYATAELEERALALADSLGLAGAQVSVTPTLIELSLGPLAGQRTYTLRVRPPALDLGKIAGLDELAQGVLGGSVDTDAAVATLEEIHARPPAFSWPVVLGAYALAGTALTPVIGGGWREAAAAALVGLVVGGVALGTKGTPRTEPIGAPLAAIVASICAAALAELGMDISPDVVVLAALVTYLPGMTLTAGVRELATEHLQSGVANTATALVQLLGLVFGVEVGRSIAAVWFGPAHEVTPHAALAAPQLIAAVAAGLAFTVSLKARPRDALVMCSATVLALVSNRMGAALLGRQAGVFGAALLVGVAGSLVGSLLRRSPLVFLVPGVLMLAPGSAGFTSALELLTSRTVSGITAAFDTFVTAISITYGLMIAAVVLPGSVGPIRGRFSRRRSSSRASRPRRRGDASGHARTRSDRRRAARPPR
jgi:uncharacterized membrane protein YjjP (DUF1212 family)